LALIFAGRILISSPGASGWFMGGLLDQFKHLAQITDKKLNGETDDRINILLLGIGGTGHDGAYLTDTIMLVSLKPSTKQISLISIPRDLVTPVSNWEKINSIDAYAEQKNPGSGGAATAQAISQLLQIPIQYYVRADFQGFINIINELGGIQVNVENTLDDYSYPILGQEDNSDYYSRFEHLHVDKGLQTMDGELALKYARSRHALGSEGSDFARARRQQLVLEAVKAKLLSAQTLLNPVMISKLVGEINKNISTNLSSWEILRIWELFKDVDHSQIINKVFSDAPDGLLIAGRGQDGAYILTPRSGNFTEMRNFVSNIFGNNTTTPEVIAKPITISDHASVLVLNGTWISGLASKTTVFLEQAKFDVTKIANAPTRNYTNTIVYDLTAGRKSSDLAALKKITGATQSFDSPSWLKSYQPTTTHQATTSTTTLAALATSTSAAATTTLVSALTSATSTSLLSSSTSTVLTSSPADFILILGTDANQN
jgi:LCP family protein required for cell wall assembly